MQAGLFQQSGPLPRPAASGTRPFPCPPGLPFVLGMAQWLPTNLPRDTQALHPIPAPPCPYWLSQGARDLSWLGGPSTPCPIPHVTEARPRGSSRPPTPDVPARVLLRTQNICRPASPATRLQNGVVGRFYSTELSLPKLLLRVDNCAAPQVLAFSFNEKSHE